jgi:glycosyltransferase involved in cell wall biosynthesis
MPEMVGDGRVLPAGNADSWAEAMAELWRDREERRRLGAAALARAHEEFGADRFYSGLMEIYGQAAQ